MYCKYLTYQENEYVENNTEKYLFTYEKMSTKNIAWEIPFLSHEKYL